jgi:MoaA/NifB/PqqE/SkfB family radical SAM enzyme
MPVTPTPTKRFVVDPLRSCQLRCKFCYYIQSQKDWHKHNFTWEETKAVIDEGISRGNTSLQVTGGEPFLYKYIVKLVTYALENGVTSSVITNGLADEEKTQDVINAGVEDFLVSRHGKSGDDVGSHNYLTNKSDAYERQSRFLKQVSDAGVPILFNCVINAYNQEDLLTIAKEMAIWKPVMVNFINMNPHNKWAEDKERTKGVIANLNVVEPNLNAAIGYLESQGTGVNVRYYPMCKIKEEYRRTICNDLQVMQDDREWDYLMNTDTCKSYETHRQWGKDCSDRVEEKDKPCCDCDLQNICGGANKLFHQASNAIYGEVLEPQKDTIPIDKRNFFYYYRQHNHMTLKDEDGIN